MWTGENDLNALCVDVYFLKNGGKNTVSVFKNIRIRVDRAL